jgi:uncharacterized membrane protein
MPLLCALIVGVTAGLRTMLPLAVSSWCARCGILSVGHSPVAFMGYRFTHIIFTLLAISELVYDKLPAATSRRLPPAFIARVLSGGLAGATVGFAGHALLGGVLMGAIGAVAGTLGGSAARSRMTAIFGRNLPAALLEDVVAIATAVFAVLKLA